MRYPVTVHREKSGSCWLSFPDCPGVFTQGDSADEAMSHAQDAWETMYMYVRSDEAIPLPTAVKRGQRWIDIPPSISAKVLLHNELVKQKMLPCEIAKRMGISQKQLVRAMSLKYTTRIEVTAQILKALGKHFEMRLVDL